MASSSAPRDGNGFNGRSHDHIIRRTSTFTNVALQNLLSSSRNARDFTYKSLGQGEIRIICLHRGQPGSPLKCELKHIVLPLPTPDHKMSLSNRIRSIVTLNDFEAISYVWGQGMAKHELIIKGQGTLLITESLYDALQHFRLSYKERRLWADAVCIDQKNNDERAAQVEIFAAIYSLATKVLVWLGPAEDLDPTRVADGQNYAVANDTAAFAALNALGRRRMHTHHPENHDLQQLLLQLEGVTSCQCCRKSTGIADRDVASYVQAIIRLLQRPYFSRMWIIQEVLSANRVEVCSGAHRTQWPQFLFLLGAVYNAALHHDMEIKHDFPCLAACAQKLSDMSLIFLPRGKDRFGRGGVSVGNVLGHMSAFSSFECSEARDRIFAVRPVLQIEAVVDLKPDYSLEVAELYRRLVVLCMAERRPHCRNYEFLALVGTENSRFDNATVLSWVPNFHSFTERSRLKHRQYSCLDYRDISTIRERPLEFRTQFDGSANPRLKVRGRLVGRIVAIEEDCQWPSYPRSDVTDKIENIVDWYRRCREHTVGIFEEDCVDGELLHFLTCGFCSLRSKESSPFMDAVKKAEIAAAVSRHFPDLPPGCAASCRQSLDFLVYHSMVEDNQKSLYGMHVVVDPTRQFSRVAFGAEEKLAWVPRHSRIDDAVCLFSGAPFPFVVRGDFANGYRLLGDSYVKSLTVEQVFDCADCDTPSLASQSFADWSPNQSELSWVSRSVESLDWVSLI